MALPDSDHSACIDLDLSALDLALDLPGGATIALKFAPGSIPDVGGEVMKLLGEANSALAPLTPLFIVIGAVLAIFDCVKAVPQAIGFPPNPAKIAVAIAKATEKVADLLKLIPQLSIPFMVKSILGAIIAALKGIKRKLVAMFKIKVKIDTGLSLNIPNVNLALLHDNLACAQANFDLQAAALSAACGPLNKLLCLLNLFFELIGGQEIQPFAFNVDTSKAIDEVLAPLDAIINLLQGIYDAILLPGPSSAAC